MGYAMLGQDTSGIHLRQFSRAAIIEDLNGTRIAYVTADLQGVTQIVKMQVIKKLQERYGDLYNEENLMLTATHTHSGPGGFFQYLMYLVTSFGFIGDCLTAIVNGVTLVSVKIILNVKNRFEC